MILLLLLFLRLVVARFGFDTLRECEPDTLFLVPPCSDCFITFSVTVGNILYELLLLSLIGIIRFPNTLFTSVVIASKRFVISFGTSGSGGAGSGAGAAAADAACLTYVPGAGGFSGDLGFIKLVAFLLDSVFHFSEVFLNNSSRVFTSVVNLLLLFFDQVSLSLIFVCIVVNNTSEMLLLSCPSSLLSSTSLIFSIWLSKLCKSVVASSIKLFMSSSLGCVTDAAAALGVDAGVTPDADPDTGVTPDASLGVDAADDAADDVDLGVDAAPAGSSDPCAAAGATPGAAAAAAAAAGADDADDVDLGVDAADGAADDVDLGVATDASLGVDAADDAAGGCSRGTSSISMDTLDGDTVGLLDCAAAAGCGTMLLYFVSISFFKLLILVIRLFNSFFLDTSLISFPV